MTDIVNVERCDRDAAKTFLLALGFPSLVRTVDGSLALLDEGGEAALQTLAADRTASEQRGYDRAIAEVVAMLDAYIVENPGAEGALHAKWIKDAIEAGV